MRGRNRKKKAKRSYYRNPDDDAREDLERRWAGRINYHSELTLQVTAGSASWEPYHRWLSYRQGFSPELVRQFIEEAVGPDPTLLDGSLLDPFSGAGTLVIESARRDLPAVGIEAGRPLVFLVETMYGRDIPQMTVDRNCQDWREVAAGLTEPIDRAALMCAVGRQYTAAGKLNRNAKPLPELLEEVLGVIRDDLRTPLMRHNPVFPGDARDMSRIESDSIGGVLTSPPYISRYDYTKILGPYQQVHDFWYEPIDEQEQRRDQIPAHPRAAAPEQSGPSPVEAVNEVCRVLAEAGESKLSRMAGTYFADMFAVLRELARVMHRDAYCWIVIGGSRPKGVYIPSDLILAEYALSLGFTCEGIAVARQLIGSGRKLGQLSNVAPRESVVMLQAH